MRLACLSALTGGVGGQDGGQVAVSEPLIKSGVTEGPVDPFGAVQPGKRDRFGHLHSHPGYPSSGGFDQPQTGFLTYPQELLLSVVGGLGLAVQRPGRPGWVMGIVDTRVPGGGAQPSNA